MDETYVDRMFVLTLKLAVSTARSIIYYFHPKGHFEPERTKKKQHEPF